MSEEVSVIIREVTSEDHQAVQSLMQKVARETDFLTLNSPNPPQNELKEVTQVEQLCQSLNTLILVALADEEIIGLASIKGEEGSNTSHIGEVGISVARDYWGIGLGQLLIGELITWAEALGNLKRLELRVQIRNERAVHLYQKLGFEIEGTLKNAAFTAEGDLVDVYMMGLLLN